MGDILCQTDRGTSSQGGFIPLVHRRLCVSSLDGIAHDSKYRAVACSGWVTSNLTLRTFTAFGITLGGQYTSHKKRLAYLVRIESSELAVCEFMVDVKDLTIEGVSGLRTRKRTN